MASFPPCDPEIFESGSVACTFHARAAVTEPWVKRVAELSGQRVDWHYAGGYVRVLFLGSRERVLSAIRQLEPDLRAAAAGSDRPLERFQIYGGEA